MLERLSPQRRNLVLLVLGILVAAFAWKVRAVLNPLILGYFLAFIVAPLVRKLESRGLSRRAAANLIFMSAAAITLVFALILYRQGSRLVEELVTSVVAEADAASGQADAASGQAEAASGQAEAGPDGGSKDNSPGQEVVSDDGSAPGGDLGEASFLRRIRKRLDLVVTEVGTRLGVLEEGTSDTEGPTVFGLALTDLGKSLHEKLLSDDMLDSAGQAGIQATGGLFRFLVWILDSLIGIGTLVSLLPVYTYFLLFELDRIHAFVARYMPNQDRERIVSVGRQIGEVVSNFFRGRLLVCFFKGLLISLGLWVLGIPFAFLVGMTSGFLSLIPFVGPMIGFVVSLVLSLSGFEFFGALWRNASVFILAEVIEGYVLLPKILGDSLGLHEVVVLAAIMVGGAALGMFGMLISLPLTASIVILAKEFVLPALAKMADEEPEDPPGESMAT